MLSYDIVAFSYPFLCVIVIYISDIGMWSSACYLFEREALIVSPIIIIIAGEEFDFKLNRQASRSSLHEYNDWLNGEPNESSANTTTT